MTPLRDYGLIGDGHTAALVSSRGSIDWWCAPRFDSPPVLDALLGGENRVRLTDGARPERFSYEADTNVLHLAWPSSDAAIFMPYPRRERSEIFCIARAGERRSAILVDPEGKATNADIGEAEAILDATRDAWRAWVDIEAPPSARRSLLALKLLTYEPTGAVVAAPTTSLPEVPGGIRNWDYRYAWIRDTAFCAHAYAQWGKADEAARIARWLLDRVVPRRDVRVLYRVDGEPAPDEQVAELPGYADSHPVHVGNGAIHQFQLDAYGHVLETLDIGHALDKGELQRAWPELRELLDELIGRWKEPDNGIWEIPAGARHHSYSKVMAWSALDRAISIARAHGLDAPVDRWGRAREAIRADVLAHGLDPGTRAFRQAYGLDAADASTLRIPLAGFVEPHGAEARATLQRVIEELAEPRGLVRRYRTADGLPGHEGAFLACSFWLAELQCATGDLPAAAHTLQAAERHGGDLGLFPEEIDPASGDFRGNYPLAISHASHLCALAALRDAKIRHRVEA